ncbi:uncharacterized protein I206_105656 [Kwoniella pini CBS 10737]|uniref:Elongator complex protein 5 n=1 Tax=Kwoniella pini CBS 10737 TaxID=1296096 RepID=A0A1B9I3M5_9TREE|nr:uncharacterized protein I206_03442 [Kwoniella pini CBS 10737]OCF50125.1 hypothetical protein I206_03442 [Kwoniella pini CBS 10737]
MPPRSIGDTGALLAGILDNTQVPHQSLCVINDGLAFSGLNIYKDILSRGIRRGEEITLISILHPPETLLPIGSTSTSSSKIRIIDLSNSISGYDSVETIDSIKDKILSTYTSGQIFIDALDILAEDYSPSKVISLVRNLLNTIKKAKAPSRLVLLLPPKSTLYNTIIPPTFNPTLTLITAHPPKLIEHLSKLYLSPISTIPSPNLWMILENSIKRSINDDLSFKSDSSSIFEFDPNWYINSNAIIQVLIRKSIGGIKGISRSLEGIKLLEIGDNDDKQIKIVELDELLNLNPFNKPSIELGESKDKQINNHSELDLPFNLNLTDEQKKKRAQVPLPYAHEGEGASGDLIWEDEEETDDEEI